MYEMDCTYTGCQKIMFAKSKEKLAETVKEHYKTEHITNMPDAAWKKLVEQSCRKTKD